MGNELEVKKRRDDLETGDLKNIINDNILSVFSEASFEVHILCCPGIMWNLPGCLFFPPGPYDSVMPEAEPLGKQFQFSV